MRPLTGPAAAQTCAAVMSQFHASRVSGVREEPQLREQDFGNFQDSTGLAREKAERESYGRFFYRFPNGESGADVYDRCAPCSARRLRGFALR